MAATEETEHKHTENMTNYSSLAKLIRSAQTRAALEKMETRCTRHYELGTITAKELMRLDCFIMEKLALISILTH